MISKEDLEKFCDISEKIEQELRRIVPILEDVYGRNALKLSEKKEVRFVDISLNLKGYIDCRIYSNYISDNLNIPYRIELKYLTMPDDKFAAYMKKEKESLDKKRAETVKKEAEERALYVKLREKYGDLENFQF
jgi:hypothetical protein